MRKTAHLSSKRTLVIFILAMTGSVVGTLLGPNIISQFSSAPPFLLPLLLCGSVLLALVADYIAFKLPAGFRKQSRNGRDDDA